VWTSTETARLREFTRGISVLLRSVQANPLSIRERAKVPWREKKEWRRILLMYDLLLGNAKVVDAPGIRDAWVTWPLQRRLLRR
jgi:hypothetical protein